MTVGQRMKRVNKGANVMSVMSLMSSSCVGTRAIYTHLKPNSKLCSDLEDAHVYSASTSPDALPQFEPRPGANTSVCGVHEADRPSGLGCVARHP